LKEKNGEKLAIERARLQLDSDIKKTETEAKQLAGTDEVYAY